jgi:hypothetical protein
MRRVSLLLLTLLLPFTTGASAQVHVVVQGTTTTLATVSPDAVVARLMSFDKNNDGRLVKAELVERMRGIVARGDANRDGALDRVELLALATTPPRRTGQLPNGYGFADQFETSSRTHIQDSLADLRLTGAKKQRASAIVTSFVTRIESAATADLTSAVEPLLTPEQLAGFKWSLEHRTRDVVPLGNRDNLAPIVQQFRLEPASNKAALAALERYKARVRLGAIDRSALLTELKGVLSTEERDNFRAALERRPVVATGANRLAVAVVRPMAAAVPAQPRLAGRIIDPPMPTPFVPVR